MKIVIQCAGRKLKAGRMRVECGPIIFFVACPENHEAETGTLFFRPDDDAGPEVGTWRNLLIKYNDHYRQGRTNPEGFRSAGELYSPPVYQNLIEEFGSGNVYILSAGWGLVRSEFLLPDYDITFSSKGNPWARRGKTHDGTWRDFNHLCDDDLPPNEPVHFFGGKDYLRMYYRLVAGLAAHQVIHHKGAEPQGPKYQFDKYLGDERYWHHPAAEDFIRVH